MQPELTSPEGVARPRDHTRAVLATGRPSLTFDTVRNADIIVVVQRKEKEGRDPAHYVRICIIGA